MNVQEFPNIELYYKLMAQNDQLTIYILLTLLTFLCLLVLARLHLQKALPALGGLSVCLFWISLIVLAVTAKW